MVAPLLGNGRGWIYWEVVAVGRQGGSGVTLRRDGWRRRGGGGGQPRQAMGCRREGATAGHGGWRRKEQRDGWGWHG
jgi:hypothetical protein